MSDRRFLAVLLTLGVLTACTGGSGARDDSRGPEEPVITAAVDLEPSVIEADPLWTWDNQSEPVGITDISLHGDLAVVVGDEGADGRNEFSVVEAGTGRPLWSMSDLDPIEALDASFVGSRGMSVTGEPGEELVVVGYYSPDCVSEPCPPPGRQSPETGVAALDLRTGALRWTYPAIASVDEQADPDRSGEVTLRIQGDSRGTPLVTIGPVNGLVGEQPSDPELFSVVALSSGSGEELWSVPEVSAGRVFGDVVVAFAPPPGPSGTLTGGTGGPVVIDLATGEERWSLAEQFPRAEILGAGGGQLTFLTRASHSSLTHHVVDLADGTVLHELDTPLGMAAVDPSTGMLGYRTQENLDQLTTVLPDEPGPALTGTKSPHRSGPPLLAHDGYLFLHDTAEDETTVVDRSGAVHQEGLDGWPVSVTEHYLVLRQGSGDDATIAVHARTTPAEQ
ncbi:PQQ-binding-like beta-propeller repeat protein [Aeromicrobium sp. CTD01-1L150]|uniref:outer membrane protein assembly factor BamB family protein n=1 Tax=Aeromicrobium sp. CTD01-1L150 TaxID=3341830 RepID=UPI0035C141D8